MHVIAVDDDHAGRELLRMVLEASGHTVRTAASVAGVPEIAAAAVGTTVVVTDLLMGGAGDDGYRLIEAIRSDPALDPVGVVAVTGVTSGRDLARARAIGADACIAKPIDVTHFLRVLDEVVATRPAPRTGSG
ncbi:response regulator [Pseudonocardia alni]|uniref:response regulator n=1 Tax=Pseudonocardia alni TaxID=33907 RepID=UPI0033CC5D3A